MSFYPRVASLPASSAVARSEGRLIPLALGARPKCALWVALLALTTLLLTSPIHLQLVAKLPSSTLALQDAVLFAGIHYAWAFILLLLMLAKTESPWEKPALVVLAGLIYLGFWTLGTSEWGKTEDWNTFGHMTYIAETSHVGSTNQANLGYFNFPGLHIMGSVVQQIAGTDLTLTRTAFLLVQSAYLPLLFFMICLSLLNNTHSAALGAVLFMQGNLALSRAEFFFPAMLGLVYVALLLVILLRSSRGPLDIGRRFPLIVILIALTITHLPSNTAILLMMAGIFFAATVRKRADAEPHPQLASLLPYGLVIGLAWEMYWAVPVFEEAIRTISSETRVLDIGYFLVVSGQNVGLAVPWWVSLTHLLLLALTYVPGAIVLLWWLVTRAPLSYRQGIMLGGLVGVVGLGIFGLMIERGGEFDWLVYYAGFFTVPALLYVIGQQKPRRMDAIFIALAALLLVLSLPSFLANNGRVGRDAVYASDVSANRFLGQSFSDHGKGLTAYMPLTAIGASPQTTIREASFRHPPEAFDVKDADEAMDKLQDLAEEFQQFGEGGRAIFADSTRIRVLYEAQVSIPATDQRWQQLESTLAGANAVYDNGEVRLYSR